MVVMVRNTQERTIVEKFNQTLKPEETILIAENPKEAQVKLNDWIHLLGGTNPPFTFQGLVNAEESELALILKASIRNVTIMGPERFKAFVSLTGVQSLLDHFKAQFQMEKSA